jgi:hypothetical protein
MDMPVDAFLTALYTIVDDWYQAHAPALLAGKVGDHPEFADSEVLTLSLAQHWLGYHSERRFLRFLRHNYLPLFPRLLDQSQFNRRARSLCWLLNAFRRWLAEQAGALTAGTYLLDGTPIHVRHWRRYGPHSLMFPGAAVGYCAAKKETFYGYKLVLLLTVDGRLLDFVLLPANADERTALDELLPKYRHFKIYADKGFLDQGRQERLYQRYGHQLYTPKRKNQKAQHPKGWEACCARIRQRVETAIDQGKDFFGLEEPGALTFWGLCSRLLAKLTGLTLAAWANGQRGRAPLLLADFTF